MDMMGGVKCVWYNVEVDETIAYIKIKVGRSHEDDTLIQSTQLSQR